jgi:hypothetical protein
MPVMEKAHESRLQSRIDTALSTVYFNAPAKDETLLRSVVASLDAKVKEAKLGVAERKRLEQYLHDQAENWSSILLTPAKHDKFELLLRKGKSPDEAYKELAR